METIIFQRGTEKQDVKKFEFNKKDLAILNSFYTFPWLPADQVCSIHYDKSSIKYVKARLAWLVKERYLRRTTYPKSYYPYFYRLALRGTRTINKTPAFYPSKRVHFTQLDHLLLTNEVLISSLALPEVLPDTTLEEIYHDAMLKCLLKEVVPDGLIFLRIKDEQVPIWFEISIELREAKFKEKIAGILRCIRTELRETFPAIVDLKDNRVRLTVCFLTPKEDQVATMMKWTQEALLKLGEVREADLFRFAHISGKDIDPIELFTKPVHHHLLGKGYAYALI